MVSQKTQSSVSGCQECQSAASAPVLDGSQSQPDKAFDWLPDVDRAFVEQIQKSGDALRQAYWPEALRGGR